MLLTVVPVGRRARGSGWRVVSQARLGLAASLLVTALYHLGFAEFRGVALIQPLIGNAIVTLGKLATGWKFVPTAMARQSRDMPTCGRRRPRGK